MRIRRSRLAELGAVADKEGRDVAHQYEQSLSHPLRLSIFRLAVRRGQTSPARASRALDEKLKRVAYHTKVLNEAGLLTLATTRKISNTIVHVYAPVPAALEHPVVKDFLRKSD